MSLLPTTPQPPPSDPVGEPEWPRVRRDFWEAVGSGQAGLALLLIGVLAAAGAAWISQENHLDVLATTEWVVGLGVGVPLVVIVIVFFRVALGVPKAQRDEARAAYQRQREAAEANVVLDLMEGVVIGEWDHRVVLQPKVLARNTGLNNAPVHDWRAVLRIDEQSRTLSHHTGEQPLQGSLELPLLDRTGPLPPGLTAGYLHFTLPGMTQREFEDIRKNSARPLSLRVEAYGPVQRWEGEFDFRADYATPRKTVDALAPRERLRALSREGHQLRAAFPAEPTPARIARLEPRIDDWSGRVRDFLSGQRPECLGQLDAIPAYVPASLEGENRESATDAGAYLRQVLGVVDAAITAG